MNPLKQIFHWIAYQMANMGARILLRCFMRVRVTGREHLPRNGAFLLVCNHISHFDPPLLASSLWRGVSWVVALDMYAHPLGWAYFNAIDSIPVDRQQTDRKAVREILKRFKKGDIIGLFPEGGIRAGSVSVIGGAPLDDSVGAIAQLGRVAVVPTVILGADKLYAWKAWLWTTTIDIRFGKPIAHDDPSLSGDRSALSLRVAKAIRGLSSDLQKDFKLTEDDLPKTPQERWGPAKKSE